MQIFWRLQRAGLFDEFDIPAADSGEKWQTPRHRQSGAKGCDSLFTYSGPVSNESAITCQLRCEYTLK